MRGIVKVLLRMLILAERPWRRVEAVSRLEEWVKRVFLEAGGRSLKLSKGEGGWIRVEADDERLLSSILRLNMRFDPISTTGQPHAAKVVKIGRGRVSYEYPLPDGSTMRKTFHSRDWAVQLGYEGDDSEEFLEALGVVEGMSISTSLNMPSSIQMRMFLDEVLRGLDRIVLIDLTPQEVEEILESGFNGFTAFYETITPLTHIIYLKLGASLDRASKRLEALIHGIAPGASYRPLSWRRLSMIDWSEVQFEM